MANSKIDAEIARLEQIVNGAVKVDESDSSRVEFDQAAAAKRLAYLKRVQSRGRRPFASGIDLGGF